MVSLSSSNIVHLKKDNLNKVGFKTKEPKFVPYEPYKAAVNPIIPIPRHRGSRKYPNTSTASVHSSVPVQETSQRKTSQSSVSVDLSQGNEEDVCKPAVGHREEVIGADSSKEWEEERKSMEVEIQQLKDDNSQLETQLKFQAQVWYIELFLSVTSRLFISTTD